MATATRTRYNKKADTRKLNDGQNIWPAQVIFTVFIDGEEVGPKEAIQGAKYSESGNVTYKGSVSGWVLDGEPTDTLRALSIIANGQQLKVGAEGVHKAATTGNPTVFMSTNFELVAKDGSVLRYQARARATYLVKSECYSLHVEAWLAPTPAARGPQVVGGIGEGFVLRPRPTKAA